MNKQMAVALALALFVGTAATAYADGGSHGSSNSTMDDERDHGKITICHRTGSTTNPFVMITIDEHGLNGHGHGDIIPAPQGGCPGGDQSPAAVKITQLRPDDDKVADHAKVIVKTKQDPDGDDRDIRIVQNVEVERNLHLSITVDGERVILRDLDRNIDLTGHLKVLLLVNGQMLGTETDQNTIVDLGSLKLTVVANGFIMPTGSVAAGENAMGTLVIVIPQLTPNLVAPLSASTQATPASFVILPAVAPTTAIAPADVLADTLVPTSTPALMTSSEAVPDTQAAQILPAAAGNAGLAGIKDSDLAAATAAAMLLLVAVGGARWITASKR